MQVIKGYSFEFKDLCGTLYNFQCNEKEKDKYYISTNNGQLHRRK